MRLALVNMSTLVPDEELRLIASALDVQLNQHLRPIWRTPQVLVDFVPRGEGSLPGAWELIVADTSDVQKALGYHETREKDLAALYQTEDGEPRGFAFAKDCLDSGAALSVTISHEALELIGNPHCDAVIYYRPTRTGYARELADPIENDRYGYRIGDVLVSDFLTPAWFDVEERGAVYDYTLALRKPRTIAPGGYHLSWTKSKGWVQTSARDGRTVQAQSSRELVGRPGTGGRSALILQELTHHADSGTLPARQ